MKTQIEMKFKKTTQRTVVYINEEPGVAVNQIYVQKTAFTPKIPEVIIVTLVTPDE